MNAVITPTDWSQCGIGNRQTGIRTTMHTLVFVQVVLTVKRVTICMQPLPSCSVGHQMFLPLVVLLVASRCSIAACMPSACGIAVTILVHSTLPVGFGWLPLWGSWLCTTLACLHTPLVHPAFFYLYFACIFPLSLLCPLPFGTSICLSLPPPPSIDCVVPLFVFPACLSVLCPVCRLYYPTAALPDVRCVAALLVWFLNSLPVAVSHSSLVFPCCPAIICFRTS